MSRFTYGPANGLHRGMMARFSKESFDRVEDAVKRVAELRVGLYKEKPSIALARVSHVECAICNMLCETCDV